MWIEVTNDNEEFLEPSYLENAINSPDYVGVDDLKAVGRTFITLFAYLVMAFRKRITSAESRNIAPSSRLLTAKLKLSPSGPTSSATMSGLISSCTASRVTCSRRWATSS